MSNVLNLRKDLIKVYNELRTGKIGISEAKAASNVAGKIINSAKTQLDYNKHTNSKGKIKFLESDE